MPIGNFTYRGWNSAASNDQQHNVWRASATYVTGAHSMKVGYQAAYQVQHQTRNADSMLSYTFHERVPTSFTLRVAPDRVQQPHPVRRASTSRINGRATG